MFCGFTIVLNGRCVFLEEKRGWRVRKKEKSLKRLAYDGMSASASRRLCSVPAFLLKEINQFSELTLARRRLSILIVFSLRGD